MTEHRFISVYVGDRVYGYVSVCACGWSGMKIVEWRTAYSRWKCHKASREYWDPIRAERERIASARRCAAAVLERVTNPCPRCEHMHMRDPVWTCEWDCRTCNPGLTDKSYGPEYVEHLRRVAS